MNSYPIEFYKYGRHVKLSDAKINEWIEELVERMQFEEPGAHSYYASGDTIVYVHKYEDEIVIRVCKNYEALSINI